MKKEREKMVTLEMKPETAGLVIALLDRLASNLAQDENGYWVENSEDWKCRLSPAQFSGLHCVQQLVVKGLERAGYSWAGKVDT